MPSVVIELVNGSIAAVFMFVVRRIRKPCLPSGPIMHISAGSST